VGANHLRKSILVAACLFCLSLAAEAAEPPSPGQAPAVIRKIEIVGVKFSSEEEIRKQIRSKIGATYSRDAVSEDLSRIFELGHFSNVTIKREPYQDGIALIYVVEEKPLLAKVLLEGNKAFDRDKLLREAGLAEGAFVDYFDLSMALDRLRRFYKEAGYNFSEVSRDVRETPEGLEVSFHISEGPKVHITKVQFLGNVFFSDRQLMQLVQTRAKQFIFAKGILDTDQLELDALRVRRFYYDRGWLDAQVTTSLDYSPDKSKVVVNFNIDEGERYRVGYIELMGNKAFDGRTIRQKMTLTPGEFFTRDKLNRDTLSILDLYGSEGFANARVTPKTSFVTEKALVNIDYSIEEGEKFVVDRIVIRGNYKTKDKVIRREISLAPGELLRTDELAESRRRLIETWYFSQINVSLEPGSFPGSKDIYVDVVEQTTGGFLFGLGVSTSTGLIGTISLTQRNFDIAGFPRSLSELLEGRAFTGAGQVLELTMQPGSELSRYRVRFYEPYLFDRPVGLDLQGYLWQRRFENYDEQRLGGTVTFSRRFTRHLTLSLGLRLEEVEINNVGENAPPDVLAVQGSGDVRSIILAATYDRRDSVWFPTRGYYLRASFENAGTLLGGDYDFNRIILNAKGYKTIYTDDRGRPHIISVSGEAGIVDDIGSSNSVPVFERFFVGGHTSIRGFAFREVGPRQLDKPVGGEVLLLGNIEYSFPIFERSVRGVTFLDIGAVYPDTGDVSLSDLRSSVGFGIRVYLPFFRPIPLSFDWGFPVHSLAGDKEQTFSFSIGTVF